MNKKQSVFFALLFSLLLLNNHSHAAFFSIAKKAIVWGIGMGTCIHTVALYESDNLIQQLISIQCFTPASTEILNNYAQSCGVTKSITFLPIQEDFPAAIQIMKKSYVLLNPDKTSLTQMTHELGHIHHNDGSFSETIRFTTAYAGSCLSLFHCLKNKSQWRLIPCVAMSTITSTCLIISAQKVYNRYQEKRADQFAMQHCTPNDLIKESNYFIKRHLQNSQESSILSVLMSTHPSDKSRALAFAHGALKKAAQQKNNELMINDIKKMITFIKNA